MTEGIGCGLRSAAGESIPLRAVEMAGEVQSGQLRIKHRQRYENRESRPLEAIYVFPVPAEASVISFAMESDGRRLESQLREREAAFEAYYGAVQSGEGAALLECERPNVFSASLGNLLPGESATIELEYIQRLHAQEGALRVVLPTLVAPRYIPGTPQGDRTAHGSADPTAEVPDADRITPRIGPADYDVSLDLCVRADVGLLISSPSHPLDTTPIDGGVRARLLGEKLPLDRDIVLWIEAGEAGAELHSTCAHRQGPSGYVAVSYVPDLGRELGALPRTNLDVAFVLDRSGSMEGASIEEALKALRLCLRQLCEGDRFSILRFSDDVESFRAEPVVFTQKTLEQADAWLAETRAAGGTELLPPLLSALDCLRSSEPAREPCVVLLTDGQVGDEARILKKVLARGHSTRIYTFGIGTNVSDALLVQLANETHGGCEFIHPGERIDEKVVATFARAIAARVRDLRAEWVDVNVADLAPGEPPPLVDGEPWSWSGRYRQPGSGALVLRGTLQGKPWSLRIPVTLPAAAEAPGLPQLWAAERIRDLEAAQRAGAELAGRITALALEHGVASRYTSFVVIESRDETRRAKQPAQARPIPVHAPAGWAMFERMPRRASFARGGMIAMAAPMGSPAPYGTARGGAPYGTAWGGRPQLMRARMAIDVGHAGNASGGFAPSPRAAPRRFAIAAEAAASSNSISARGAGGGGHELGFARPSAGSIEMRDLGEGRGPTAADPAFDILSRQLASGLWKPVSDEPGADRSDSSRDDLFSSLGRRESGSSAKSGAEPPRRGVSPDESRGSGTLERAPGVAADAARLEATTRALIELLRLRVDAGHAQYGPQIRKAVGGLMPLAAALAHEHPALSERALGVAWLATTGRRTRQAIRKVIQDHGLTALAARLSDDVALRSDVLNAEDC